MSETNRKSVLDKIALAWEILPSYRLGQLMYFLMSDLEEDLFYVTDDKIIAVCEEIIADDKAMKLE
jgi:hypothetical protein